MSTEIDSSSSGIFPEDSGIRINRDSTRSVERGRVNLERSNEPVGIKLLEKFYKYDSVEAKKKFQKVLVLLLTFVAYASYHMGRRPLSIVKNVLNRNCSELHPSTLNNDAEQFLEYYNYHAQFSNDSSWCDWAPFNDDTTANQLLAILDSAFLFSYAFFMFFSGFLADRCNLRYFLSIGMISSGFLLYAFGLSFYLNIHSMTYFLIVQILSGAMHTTGWPTVVTCVGNWFGPSSRGLVFGFWNSHTNIGNILGATISGYFVEKAWGLSFMVPGFIMLVNGIIVFLFLVPRPEDVGLSSDKSLLDQKQALEDDHEICSEIVTDSNISTTRRKICKVTEDEDSAVSEIDTSQTLFENEHSPLINAHPDDVTFENLDGNAASFRSCLRIPGVVEYSLCLFFSKLVSYTFLYWLPRYITQSTLNSSEDSAYLSTPFDIGGIIGAILAGYLTDKYKASGIVCSLMLFTAIPAMFTYEKLASISNIHNIVLQIFAGALVNGPYALITTAVSTDLSSRVKSGKAMATVAAIIDGTGSIGAAVGPLFAGFVSDSGWQSVFIMLMLSDLLASICLIRITSAEIKQKFFRQSMSD